MTIRAVPEPGAVPRRITVIGTGLIGTSIALAARRGGVHVGLSDRDRESVAAAERMGAGVALRPDTPAADLVVIATPPSAVVGTLREAQARGLGAVYTDVASTKARIVADAAAAGCDLDRFVPGHPMAGRELSGPAGASADLFAGRPWALCPRPRNSPAALGTVWALAAACGAVVRLLPAEVHDRVVAAVSHVPHLVAAVLAAPFAARDDITLSLVGKGVLDVTRIAAGSPQLWCDILRQNAENVAAALDGVISELMAAAAALRDPAAGDTALIDLLSRGNTGRGRLAA